MHNYWHSFNQFLLPVENGFAAVDFFDECYSFYQAREGEEISRINSFEFKGPKDGLWATARYSQMAGLAKTSSGFLFAGTYEKNDVATSIHNDARNIFILKFNEGMTEITQPVWITHYTDIKTDNAAHPKIVQLDPGRYLLMWEKMLEWKSTYYESEVWYTTTCYTIIDEDGNILKPIAELPGVRLSFSDVLRYNEKTGRVHWSVNGEGHSIISYALDPDAAVSTRGRKGDVNGDNAINIFDIMAIRDHIFGITPLTGDAFWRADCNDGGVGDGVLNIFDIMAVRDIIFGLLQLTV